MKNFIFIICSIFLFSCNKQPQVVTQAQYDKMQQDSSDLYFSRYIKDDLPPGAKVLRHMGNGYYIIELENNIYLCTALNLHNGWYAAHLVPFNQPNPNEKK